MTTPQAHDYVTRQEFKDFAHKNELAHEKISGDISNLRKDIEAQNTKIDAQNNKIDNLTDKFSSEIKLLGKEMETTLLKAVHKQTLWFVATLLTTIGFIWFHH